MSLEDQFDITEPSYFPLTVVRVYSAYIHKRRSMGPMGTGWLLNLWYVCCNIYMLWLTTSLISLKGTTY